MELLKSLLAISVFVNIFLCPLEVLRLLERQKADKRDHLAKLGEFLYAVLHFLQPVANCVGFVYHFEDRIAHRAFVEQEVGHLAGCRV